MPVPNMKAKPPRPNEEPYAGKLLVRFREGLGRRLPSLLDKNFVFLFLFFLSIEAKDVFFSIDTLFDTAKTYSPILDTFYIYNKKNNEIKIDSIHLINSPFINNSGTFGFYATTKTINYSIVKSYDFSNWSSIDSNLFIKSNDSLKCDHHRYYGMVTHLNPNQVYILKSDGTTNLTLHSGQYIVSATFEFSFSSGDKDTIAWKGPFDVAVESSVKLSYINSTLFNQFSKDALFDIRGCLLNNSNVSHSMIIESKHNLISKKLFFP